ncbi:hypothetical protein BDZ97DRAFT_1850979 [Flammula alnicola]|nr:hypothetical protein BDZ97DRAFT_1850979 [Flammula alnicola]
MQRTETNEHGLKLEFTLCDQNSQSNLDILAISAAKLEKSASYPGRTRTQNVVPGNILPNCSYSLPLFLTKLHLWSHIRLYIVTRRAWIGGCRALASVGVNKREAASLIHSSVRCCRGRSYTYTYCIHMCFPHHVLTTHPRLRLSRRDTGCGCCILVSW